MELDTEALDRLTADCKTPADVEKIDSQMLQRMINRSLEAEMTVHLDYERHAKGEAAFLVFICVAWRACRA